MVRGGLRGGLTFTQLLASTGAEPEVLAYVLRDEQRLGRVVYRSTSRRYELNGGLDAAALAAFRNLARPGALHDRHV